MFGQATKQHCFKQIELTIFKIVIMISRIFAGARPLLRLITRPNYPKSRIANTWFNQHKSVHSFSNQEKSKQQRMEQAKRQGQQFYNTQISDIIELKHFNEFPTIVQTCQVPLVINFYAEWNMTCKNMTPKLQSQIKQANGQLKLVNVNIDKFGEVVKIFQVRSVPTICLVYQGKMIDSFAGELSDQMLGKFIETAARASSFDKGDTAAVKSIEEAQIAMRDGDFAKAEKILIDLKTSNIKEEFGLVKNIFLAYIYGEQGKLSHLKSIVEVMNKNEEFYLTKPEFKDLYLNLCSRCQQIEKAKEENSEMSQLRARLQHQPQNLQLKYQAATFYQQNDLYEQALTQLLNIVKVNKQWQQKKANKAILQIFKKLGNASPITQNYRKLFQRALH